MRETDGLSSAILLLRITYLSEVPASLSSEGILQAHESIREVLRRTLEHFQRFRNGWGDLSRYPPHALDWLYRIAAAVVHLANEFKTPQYHNDIEELKFALEYVAPRWQAAGECCLVRRMRDEERPLTISVA
jgi:hypothetical protein